MPKRNGPGIELLAEPMRRHIVAELALCPQRPSSLATKLGRSRPAISHQLALLRGAGLIERRRGTLDGRVLVYAIRPRAHGPITAWLAGTQVGRPIGLAIDDDGTLDRE